MTHAPPLSPLNDTPPVSYVMPVLNEETYLEAAVTRVLAQSYAGDQELVLVLAPSTDRSGEIARDLADRDDRIRLIENPARDIPAGLNLGFHAARHDVIVRVDAHSELQAGYTARAINTLRETGAANVGGVMQAEGEPGMQAAIARAYNSPYGLGGGAYHGEGTPGPGESAYLGVFRREAVSHVGGFDERILRGEDWELNLRLRQAGYLIWFDPNLRVTYRPRASLSALRRQFFATGAWRAVIVRRYGRENPLRFFIPGALVLGVGTGLSALLLMAVRLLRRQWWPLCIPLAAYLLGVAYAALRIEGQRGIRDRLRTAAVLVTMHLSWGAGFLRGISGGAPGTLDRSRI